jgi:hypothetical protein
MYILYDFVCYDLLHILLSCDKIMDPWNLYMYICNNNNNNIINIIIIIMFFVFQCEGLSKIQILYTLNLSDITLKCCIFSILHILILHITEDFLLLSPETEDVSCCGV